MVGVSPIFEPQSTKKSNPLFQGFSRPGGGQYFDPQTASAIRGKVKVVTIDSQPSTFTLNPWSGGFPSAMQKGTVKFFNDAKGFGRVVGGGHGSDGLVIDVLNLGF
jgi:hypothetical protein